MPFRLKTPALYLQIAIWEVVVLHELMPESGVNPLADVADQQNFGWHILSWKDLSLLLITKK